MAFIVINIVLLMRCTYTQFISPFVQDLNLTFDLRSNPLKLHLETFRLSIDGWIHKSLLPNIISYNLLHRSAPPLLDVIPLADAVRAQVRNKLKFRFGFVQFRRSVLCRVSYEVRSIASSNTFFVMISLSSRYTLEHSIDERDASIVFNIYILPKNECDRAAGSNWRRPFAYYDVACDRGIWTKLFHFTHLHS